MNRRRRLGLAVAVAVMGACGSTASTSQTSYAVEFSRGRHGGLCPSPDGGGDVCRWEVTVLDDGTWTAVAFSALPGPSGAVRLGAASELASVLEGGWSAVTELPFEGTCPTAYDGSESTYRVRRIPQGPGAELADAVVLELRSCTFDLEHPRARAILDRIDALWEELGLPS